MGIEKGKIGMVGSTYSHEVIHLSELSEAERSAIKEHLKRAEDVMDLDSAESQKIVANFLVKFEQLPTIKQRILELRTSRLDIFAGVVAWDSISSASQNNIRSLIARLTQQERTVERVLGLHDLKEVVRTVDNVAFLSADSE